MHSGDNETKQNKELQRTARLTSRRTIGGIVGVRQVLSSTIPVKNELTFRVTCIDLPILQRHSSREHAQIATNPTRIQTIVTKEHTLWKYASIG